MKSAAVAVAVAFAGLAAAAPFNQTIVRRQCSAPAPPATTPPAQPPTSTEAPPPPTTSDAPPPANTTTPTPSGSGEGSGAPFYSVYADTGINDAASFPGADALGDWNDLILAFWLSAGAWDSAMVWTQLGDQQKSVIDAYHAAGKKIRVSCFGATEYPLTAGGDPTTIGNNLAQFVIDNNLDGVDVDYEDSGSFESATGGGEEFLITLTKVLREKLPSPQYTITHAPQAPYFTTGDHYPNGAYVKVHKEVGDLIDGYEIQFYNQGAGAYEDCDSLWKTSPAAWPGTTVSEIIASGVPASKVIIGKPGQAGDGNNGIMAPADIGACISQNGPGTGVMAWQWVHAGPEWIAAAKGN